MQIGYFHGYIDGVDHVFVDHPCFHHLGDNIYGGDRLQIAFRCALLCKAALEAVWHVPCGGVHYGDDNLVYIANDWHTALLPVYLQVRHALQNDRICIGDVPTSMRLPIHCIVCLCSLHTLQIAFKSYIPQP